MNLLRAVVLAWGCLVAALRAGAGLLGGPAPDNFPLVVDGAAAPIVVEATAPAAASRAAGDLRDDIRRVSGGMPELRSDLADPVPRRVVVVGVVGQSALLEQLAAAGKLDLGSLRGAWESYRLAVVSQPWPGVAQALVIAGSDRRGAVYGCYEVSEAIGVSPWYWWADVTPEHRDSLYVNAGVHPFGPPAVKYRGVFLNDEDWGLQPWAAQTFEPEHGGIGPKTYGRIFELLLRLKANTLWPAMHACTPPFNAFPENARLADAYGIVMGSSHAEPMLRNNVREWTDAPERFNYLTNADGVRAYWEQRVRSNGGYENIYTLGMRGIHDSAMIGPRSDAERIRLLERIFADQRQLLTRYAHPPTGGSAPGGRREQVPQLFCAYKEVLGLYRGGLEVPDDVTVMWPDDNFGYVRHFATAAERTRAGGFGVYYHVSYLGAPLSYLWLCTTPPALIAEEMTKAYAYEARRMWIVNVGDLKPAEIATEFFLQLAWDIRRANPDDFLRAWAAREFGPAAAPEIAAILADYYRLNFQRKPEHLQWWLAGESPRPSPFTPEEIDDRLAAFAALRARVGRLAPEITPARRDAFYELVAYPVLGAALANERYFAGERWARRQPDDAERAELQRCAESADRQLQDATRRFNETIAAGKWRGFLRLEPAGPEWPQFRLESWRLPNFPAPGAKPAAAGRHGVITIEAEHFDRVVARNGATWRLVAGVGRTGPGSIGVAPVTAASVPLERVQTEATRADYDLVLSTTGRVTLRVNLIPTQPIRADRGLRLAVSWDDGPAAELVAQVADGSQEWARSVLDATVVVAIPLQVETPGRHTLHLFGEDPGVLVDKLTIDCGGLGESYLGPEEIRTERAR